MKRSPANFLIACLLLGFAGAGQVQADTSEKPSLDVAGDLTLSGPPDLEDLVLQYPRGLLIIDLRTSEEGVSEARVQAEALGIRYENIPVAGPHIISEQVETLSQLLEERDAYHQTVVHCRSGNRAGMLWGALQINAGAANADVVESLAPIVTKAPVQKALLDYSPEAAGHDDR